MCIYQESAYPYIRCICVYTCTYIRMIYSRVFPSLFQKRERERERENKGEILQEKECMYTCIQNLCIHISGMYVYIYGGMFVYIYQECMCTYIKSHISEFASCRVDLLLHVPGQI